MVSITLICGYAAFAGLASHLGFFIHGEHHRESALLAAVFPFALAALLGIQLRYLGQDILPSIARTAAITASFTGALFTSMITYRLFFHRLREFPGPLPARVSKIWHTLQAWPRLDGFRWLARCQEEYGDFVRTGPNELSIFDPDAVPIVLGPKFSRAPFYDITLPMVSMQSVRDKKIHLQRRRIWDKGINAKALRLYEERAAAECDIFVKQISARAGQVVDARDFFIWFSFDIMGAIAFGKSFGILEKGESHFALDIMSKGTVAPFGLLSYIPWTFPILASIPGNPFNKFVGWAAQLLRQRQETQKESEVFDIMGHIIQAYDQSDKSDSALQWLMGDTRLIILAGTETTSGVLTNLFYHLALHPLLQTRLRNELTALLPENFSTLSSSASSLPASLLQETNAPLLNGIINETMRLHPVGLSGLPRLSPPEGVMINDVFVPGGVTVYTPSWTIWRSPAAFEKPEEFIPERWYERPEMVKNPKAFAPWSLGPTACVGKQIALIELRLLITMLVTRFQTSFAPGDDGHSVIDEVTDHFASTPGPLKLVFTPLEKAGL